MSFRNGKWTLEVPEEKGYYPVATRAGEICASTIYIYLDPMTGVPTPVTPWQGYWWSNPLPENFGLPPVGEEHEMTVEQLSEFMDECAASFEDEGESDLPDQELSDEEVQWIVQRRDRDARAKEREKEQAERRAQGGLEPTHAVVSCPDCCAKLLIGIDYLEHRI